MNINKKVQTIVKISIINIFIILICILANLTGKFKYNIYIPVLTVYFFYLLTKNEVTIVLYQFYMMILNEFILDNIFHYIRIDTPLELKYITEFISIILIMKILINKKVYGNLMKNKVIILLLTIIIINTIIVISNNESILQLMNALRIYFRFIPVYLVIRYNNVDFKTSYRLLYMASITIFFIQVLLNFHRDFRTGIFGIIGGSVFSVFMSIKVIDLTIKFINKKASRSKLILFTLLTFAIFALAESKAFILILAVSMIAILVLSKGNILKRSVFIIITSVLLVFGVNLMVKIYPNFSYFLSVKNMKNNVENYIFGNSNPVNFSMGRFEAMNYIGNLEKNTLEKKLLGLGSGVSMPQENIFYINDASGKKVIDFPESRVFEQYDKKYGYYLSSFATMYLDNGYLGIVILIGIFFIILIKSVYLVRYGRELDSKSIGGISLCIVLASIFCCFYGSDLFYRNYSYMLCIVSALVCKHFKGEFSKGINSRYE